MAVMMIKNVAVISLWAEDVPKAAHFYRDVLGLELVEHHHDSRPHFRVGDAYLVILKGKPIPAENREPSRFPLYAFKVQDLDAGVERLVAHNIELPWGIEGSGSSRWVMFHDPAGNLVELT